MGDDGRAAHQLGDSAFALLGVSVRAGADAIARAYDNLSFSPEGDVARLDRARATLLSPRDRLFEELRWLPELAPSLAREAVSAQVARSVARLERVRSGATGLARVNLGLAILEIAPDPERAAATLSDALAWHPEPTAAAVAEARAVAGVRAVTPELWEGAVAERRAEIADFLAEACAASPGPAARLAAQAAARTPTGEGALMLDAVVSAYAGHVGPQLSRLADTIAREEQALRARPASPAAVNAIEEAAGRYGALSLPMQRLQAVRGLDHPSSSSLFRLIRSLAIDLANEHERFGDARRLTAAIKASLAHTPAQTDKAEEDLAALADLLAQVLIEQALQQVQAAHDEALRRPQVLGSHIMAGGLNGAGNDEAGKLARAFLASQAGDKQLGDRPWLIMRDVAIVLNNEHGLPEAAAQLIRWLLGQHPPVAISAKLGVDLGALRRPARAPLPLRKTSAAPSDGSGGRLILGGVAALALIAAVYGNQNSKLETTTTDNTMVTDMNATEGLGDMTSDGASTADFGPPTVAPVPAYDRSQDGEEEPSPYGYAALTRPELRWCAFEDARLKAMKARVPDAAIGPFNAAVDSFNTRCGQRQYAMSDRAIVDGEVAGAGAQIARDAGTKVEEWAAAAAPATPWYPQPTSTAAYRTYEAAPADPAEVPDEEVLANGM